MDVKEGKREGKRKIEWDKKLEKGKEGKKGYEGRKCKVTKDKDRKEGK